MKLRLILDTIKDGKYVIALYFLTAILAYAKFGILGLEMIAISTIVSIVVTYIMN